MVGISLAAAAAYAGFASAAVAAQRLVTYPWWMDRRRVPPTRLTEGFEEVRIEACDGPVLSAYWRPPLPGRPVVLSFHGIRGCHWMLAARFSSGRWPEVGAGVLAPAFRGYHGSTGWPSERGLLLDAEAALRFVRKRAPDSPVVIHGHSLGSAVAAATAARFTCFVLALEAPFTSLPEVGARWYPFLPVRRYLRDVFPTLRLIRQARAGTVVVFHGTRDRLVPFEMGQQVAAARPDALFVPLEGLGHTGLSERVDELLLPFVGRSLRMQGSSLAAAGQDCRSKVFPACAEERDSTLH